MPRLLSHPSISYPTHRYYTPYHYITCHASYPTPQYRTLPIATTYHITISLATPLIPPLNIVPYPSLLYTISLATPLIPPINIVPYPSLLHTTSLQGRAGVAIVTAWLLSVVFSLLPAGVIVGSAGDGELDRCADHAVVLGVRSLEICSYTLAGLIVVIVGLYGRIYREVGGRAGFSYRCSMGIYRRGRRAWLVGLSWAPRRGGYTVGFTAMPLGIVYGVRYLTDYGKVYDEIGYACRVIYVHVGSYGVRARSTRWF